MLERHREPRAEAQRLHHATRRSGSGPGAKPRRPGCAGTFPGATPRCFPISIKDSIAIRDVVSTAGRPDLADYVMAEDAPAVARLRAAGAVFLGHTNMPMDGDDFQSYNDLFGRTSNPWDLSRTAGGSTGGGGAAVAAGLSFLSIGSDFGGSIRVPSHFCGIFGHRGTRNVIPTEGHGPPHPGRPPRPKSEESVVGPLARSAADLKLALEVCGGPVAPESVAYRWQLPPARGNVLRDYRIGYVIDDPFCRVSSDLRETYERAIDELRAAGARLEEGWPVDDLETTYHAWYYLVAALLSPELEGPDLERARIAARLQDGSRAAIWSLGAVSPYARYIEANAERLRIQAAWQNWFRTHDAFLMPTTFVAAFPHDTESYAERWSRILQTPEGPRDYLDLHVWTSLSGLTGHPVTNTPVGLTRDGLPAGLQVLGPLSGGRHLHRRRRQRRRGARRLPAAAGVLSSSLDPRSAQAVESRAGVRPSFQGRGCSAGSLNATEARTPEVAEARTIDSPQRRKEMKGTRTIATVAIVGLALGVVAGAMMARAQESEEQQTYLVVQEFQIASDQTINRRDGGAVEVGQSPARNR